MNKRLVLLATICLVFLAALLNREGALGPPLYTYDKYGDIHIKAVGWFLPDGNEQLAAAISCGKRHMSPVSATLYHPKTLSIFGGFSIPLGPKWVHIICSA